MTARGLAMETSSPARREAELVKCRGTLSDGSTCGQLLAKRWVGGGLEVVVKGEIYDADGRVSVVCPACHLRMRMNPRKAA